MKLIGFSIVCVLMTGCVFEHHKVQDSVSKSSSPHVIVNKKQNTTSTKKGPPTFKYTISRLQDLGYLPIKNEYIHGNKKLEYHPTFMWKVPSSLESAATMYPWNWSNPFIRGAIVQFERENGILHGTGVSEGNMHSNVWAKLISDSAVPNKFPWQWVIVNKADGTDTKERLHIWEHTKRGGMYIWSTLVNTGVLHSTPDGTFIIYQRLPKTTMVGRFPIPISAHEYKANNPEYGVLNGAFVRWQPYDDHGILWVNYFDNGRGIHYYPRARYGFPQSAGCVEEPLNNSKITYKLLHYGVPVTISSKSFS